MEKYGRWMETIWCYRLKAFNMSMVILIIAIFIYCFATLIAFAAEEHGAGLFLGCVAIPLTIWFCMFCNEPWEYTTKQYKVHTIESIDLVVVDNRVFNLNKILEKDLQDGDVVNVKFPIIKRYVGIVPPQSLEDSFDFSHEN